MLDNEKTCPFKLLSLCLKWKCRLTGEKIEYKMQHWLIDHKRRQFMWILFFIVYSRTPRGNADKAVCTALHVLAHKNMWNESGSVCSHTRLQLLCWATLRWEALVAVLMTHVPVSFPKKKIRMGEKLPKALFYKYYTFFSSFSLQRWSNQQDCHYGQ